MIRQLTRIKQLKIDCWKICYVSCGIAKGLCSDMYYNTKEKYCEINTLFQKHLLKINYHHVISDLPMINNQIKSVTSRRKRDVLKIMSYHQLHYLPLMKLQYRLIELTVLLSKWLLFNGKWAISLLYHGKNKLHFSEMMMMMKSDMN